MSNYATTWNAFYEDVLEKRMFSLINLSAIIVSHTNITCTRVSLQLDTRLINQRKQPM